MLSFLKHLPRLLGASFAGAVGGALFLYFIADAYAIHTRQFVLAERNAGVLHLIGGTVGACLGLVIGLIDRFRKKRIGVGLVSVAGGLAGAIAGGFWGYVGWARAVDEDLRRGGSGDFLPVGVSLFGSLAGLLGAIVAPLMLRLWRSLPTLWPGLKRGRS